MLLVHRRQLLLSRAVLSLPRELDLRRVVPQARLDSLLGHSRGALVIALGGEPLLPRFEVVHRLFEGLKVLGVERLVLENHEHVLFFGDRVPRGGRRGGWDAPAQPGAKVGHRRADAVRAGLFGSHALSGEALGHLRENIHRHLRLLPSQLLFLARPAELFHLLCVLEDVQVVLLFLELQVALVTLHLFILHLPDAIDLALHNPLLAPAVQQAEDAAGAQHDHQQRGDDDVWHGHVKFDKGGVWWL
mmetsp:Transcript_30754/g.79865  ORF Transcript_30754/g.79865 Transcript_30754/m.79865 type:complete len:246 (+) Transcript_30754:1837-2574(+)